MRLWLLTALICLWTEQGMSADRVTRSHVYCSAAQEQSIDLLQLDLTTGDMQRVARHRIPGEPGALAAAPDRRFLFACLRSTGQLASFRIDTATGQLTTISVIEAGADPAQISVDATGRYLLTAYYVAAKVTVHSISVQGELSPQPIQSVPTADKAHAIVTDRTNRFAYVPHTGPNLIYQFEFHADKGQLTPLQPPRIERPAQTGPRHLAWHPVLPIAYIDNEQASSVTAYSVRGDGTLLAGRTVTTLPPNFKMSNSTAEIKMHPSGRYLYVSNRGHDSLAVIGVDGTGTELQFLAAEPTEKTPRSFDIDPSGQFLLSAGESSGNLSVSRIDPLTGRLQPLRQLPIGPMLWWVHILR